MKTDREQRETREGEARGFPGGERQYQEARCRSNPRIHPFDAQASVPCQTKRTHGKIMPRHMVIEKYH